jgi:ACS family hexuronate transporter-like MFS transporter
MNSAKPFPAPAVSGPMSRVRWWILTLFFFGTSVNYLDRMVMGILAPGLQKQYLINDLHYGYISSAFALSYALGQVLTGRLIDRIGIRLGYGLALASWSVASMLHAVVGSALGFGFMRGLLGAAESPAYPTATKALAEWFPRRERAFAFGFVNAGATFGAIAASALVPWIASSYGWQWAFIATGALGLVLLVFWIPIYRGPAAHPKVSAAELAHIQSDAPEPATKLSWLTLIRSRQALAFAAGKFFTDSMWWFYMAWFAKYLDTTYHLNLLQLGLPLVVIYVLSDIGSLGGGWLSSAMIKRGATVNRARKTALFIAGCAVVPILFAQYVTELWTAVLLLGLVTAAHQAFSSNLYTLVSDMFPRRAVATVAGFGGMFGYCGAFLFQLFVGYSVQTSKNYTLVFGCVAFAYLAAFAIIHLLAPKLEPAVVE